MKRLLFLGAALLCACTVNPVGASPPADAPLGFRLAADTVRITSSPCTVLGATVSCRVTISLDSTFATVLGTQNLTPGTSITPIPLSCTRLQVVTVYARAWGVNASGQLSPAYTADRQTVTCPDGVAINPANFRIFLRVDSLVTGG